MSILIRLRVTGWNPHLCPIMTIVFLQSRTFIANLDRVFLSNAIFFIIPNIGRGQQPPLAPWPKPFSNNL